MRAIDLLGCEEGRACGALDQIGQDGEYPIVSRSCDRIPLELEPTQRFGLGIGPVATSIGIEAGSKEAEQCARRPRIPEQGVAGNRTQYVAPDLSRVSQVGAQQVDAAPVEAGHLDQSVERVALDVTGKSGAQAIEDVLLQLFFRSLEPAELLDPEGRDPVGFGCSTRDLCQCRIDDANAKAVENRQKVGQIRPLELVDLEA